jgi:Conjugative transposon protein TcpC
MTSRVVSHRMWRTQLAGRAPRLAFTGLVAILALVGLRSLLQGPTASPKPVRYAVRPDIVAEAFAERFTRAYLTWNSSRPENHARAVEAFTTDGLESGAGYDPPARGSQTAVWTAAIRDEAVRHGLRIITVAAETTNSPYVVSVPVQRDRWGRLAVSRYPALVGAPPLAKDAAAEEGQPVGDAQLASVVRRAVSNYLTLQAANLRADLDGQVLIAPPARRMRVDAVEAPNWLGRGRVETLVRASADGASWTLSYEVGVVKRDRWYVRSIETDSRARG